MYIWSLKQAKSIPLAHICIYDHWNRYFFRQWYIFFESGIFDLSFILLVTYVWVTSLLFYYLFSVWENISHCRKKYTTVGKNIPLSENIPKSNQIIVETGKINTSSTHMYIWSLKHILLVTYVWVTSLLFYYLFSVCVPLQGSMSRTGQLRSIQLLATNNISSRGLRCPSACVIRGLRVDI
jgi:hypothetical protein